jgi:uncharacterized protein
MLRLNNIQWSLVAMNSSEHQRRQQTTGGTKMTDPFREVDNQTAHDIRKELEHQIRAEPPVRIALIGLTGVGKSSTLNALFNSGAPISHTRACTQEALEYETDVNEYEASEGRKIHVFDMPGLGEGIKQDKVHIKTYARVLPDVDLCLWIFSAINRAITPIQTFLMDYGHLTPTLVFGMNKVDLVQPGAEAWNKTLNLPSPDQEKNIEDREEDFREKLRECHWDGEVVSYSAEKRYQLQELLTQMLLAASDKRRWVLKQAAEVADFEDLVDKTALHRARALAGVAQASDEQAMTKAIEAI